MVRLIDVLNEIGGGTAQPFPIKRINAHKFEFSSGDAVYLVKFVVDGGDTVGDADVELYELSFGVKTNKFGGVPDTSTVTNRGEQFRVMSTIIEISKQHFNSIYKRGVRIPIYLYKPVKMGSELASGADSKRGRFYAQFVTKHPFISKNFISKNKGDAVYLIPHAEYSTLKNNLKLF
jgi:hypothetical protein